MAVISDYTTLSDAVAGYLDRSDLTTYVPNFIRSAEQMIYRQIRNRGVETEFTANTAAGGVLAISGLTDFREMKWLRTSASGGSIIEPVPIEQLYKLYPDRTAIASFPTVYARDGANFIFGPCAASGVALDGVYYKLLPALGASNTTNWFTANSPEVLLYGALTHASPFLNDDPRVAVWAGFFKESFDAVHDTAKKENRTGGQRAVRIL